MLRRTLRSAALVSALVCAEGPSPLAADSWSDPFPGVRRLVRTTSNQNINVLVVNLCSAGIEARATASSEKGRTVSSFGSLTGVQAAVNADFFSAGFVTEGPAVHAGTDWGTTDDAWRGQLAFGSGRAALIPRWTVANPEPWMRELVSGRPTIVHDGATVDNSTDPLCTAREPRTFVGLSADFRTLFIATADGRATNRIGLTCPEEAQLMLELGAHHALNLDGGGSTTMWLSGAGVVNFPSGGSERVVANHLGIFARGVGAPTSCTDRPPRGSVDSAGCATLDGWAQDPDTPTTPISVHVYIGGPYGSGAAGFALLADLDRSDLCAALGSCNHAFSLRPPRSFLDGIERPIHVYGINTAVGNNPELINSPRSLRCDPPTPPLAPTAGDRRRVPTPEIFAAWAFDSRDVAPLPPAVIDAYPSGPALSDAPLLVQAIGEPEIYLVEHAIKRHVVSREAMVAWHFDFDAVASRTTAEVDALLTGPPWADEPFLARGPDSETYLFDAPPPLRASLVSFELPAKLQRGEVSDVTLVLKNTGSHTWESGKLFLASSNPRDSASPLCDAATWPSCTRAATTSTSVPPGGEGSFRFRIRAPPVGDSATACFALVLEDRWWSADPGQGGPSDNALCREVLITSGSAAGGGQLPAVSTGCGCGARPESTLGASAALLGLLGFAASSSSRRQRARPGRRK